MVGEQTAEAFQLLGNQTRLAILLKLWEAYEPHCEEDPVPFSQLRKMVGTRDSGRFNYHLEQLTDRFVRTTDEGYELRRTGRQLVQAIISGTGLEEAQLEPSRIDKPCDFCGAVTEITYGNGYLYQVCTECPGYADLGDEHPEGTLRGRTFDPAGLLDRTATEAWVASNVAAHARRVMLVEGVCPECSGRVEKDLEICADHEAGGHGPCRTCGREERIFGSGTCSVCKRWAAGSLWPKSCAFTHPAVTAFMFDHGLEGAFTGDTDYQALRSRNEFFGRCEQEVQSLDPPKLRFTFSADGDELTLVMDETMSIVDVDR